MAGKGYRKDPKSGKFIVDFVVGGKNFYERTDITNKRSIIAYVREKREAFGKKVKTEKKTGVSQDMTVKEACDTYFDIQGSKGKDAEQVKNDLALIVGQLGPNRRIADINNVDISALIQWKSNQFRYGKKHLGLVSNGRVNRSTTLLMKRVMRMAQNRWYIVIHKMPDWKMFLKEKKEPKHRVREIQPHEYVALVQAMAADEDEFAVFKFALASGFRRAECLLEWSMINWSQMVIEREGKGDEKIYKPINPAMAAILRSRIGHNARYVFTFTACRTRAYGRKGNQKTFFVAGQRYPITEGHMDSWWQTRRLAASAIAPGLIDPTRKKSLRFHDLRHTFGMMLLRATGNLKMVQEALGHADIATTARYYGHVTIEDQRKGVDRAVGGFFGSMDRHVENGITSPTQLMIEDRRDDRQVS